MYRFYCPNLDSGVLDDEESHHALHVLRLKEGDSINVFNGHGKECVARLSRISGSRAAYTISNTSQTPEPAYHITIGQAVPKGKAMEIIIQKSTELGLRQISPILSDRSVVHLEGDKTEAKQEKWQQVAIEACKQSGQNWLPEVKPAAHLDAFLADAPRNSLKLIASLQPEAQPLSKVLSEARTAGTLANVTFLIGPEGDFTPAEIGKARSAGYLPVSLGPTILRSETAAIFLASVIVYETLRK